MTRFSCLFAFATVTSLALTDEAFAHTHLKDAFPADRATVTASPAELDLTFTEELNLKFTGIKITGPDKTEIKTGEASLKDGDKTLVVPVSGKLGAGSYSVEWHALSTDGHKTSGSYAFTVKP